MRENRTRIYARNTEVRIVDLEDAQSFVEKYHRQSVSRTQQKIVSLGIFEKNNENNLLGVAQFCSPRTSAKKREYSTELLRMAFKDDVQIIGGASKLIKYYISKYDPADIFTYQDTTGENTDVYEQCGFTLVSQDKIKKYLIAPGKTIETADRKNAEILSFSYASSYGPDNLLGVSLGEQFKDDGSRKTNIELFQDLGWTITETSGDKVYEWVNENRTYYIYRIISVDSDKYYYGVSHIKIKNASIKECLNHKYFGSGGNHSKDNKFNSWKKKHRNNLQKEIIKTFDRKSRAYEFEKKIIGDLWRTDPLCLNSMSGGHYTGTGSNKNVRITFKTCSIHGLTKHHGDKCSTCIVENAISIKNCEIHGLTKHYGDSCNQCRSAKAVRLKNCSVHGEAKHIGEQCYKCRNSGYVLDNCGIHGKTSFQGGKCSKCSSSKLTTMKECKTHGLTKHMGDVCSACRSQNSVDLRDCSIHGLTKHRGKSCSKCTADKAAHRYHIEEKGKTKENCSLCDKEIQEGARKPLVKKVVELRECPLCAEKFLPKNKRQLFCQNPHPLNCVSCGDNIMPVPRKDKKFYSCRKRECINEATRLSTLDKYGVENVSQLDSVREKISASKK